MKIKITVLMMVIMLLLSSCSVTQTSIEALISPPKLSEEQINIDAALRSKVGNNINLIYPKKGEYLSAFVVENIDAEPSNEALVFYKEDSTIGVNSTASIRINVLDQQDGAWVSVYDETTMNANEVEKLSFIEQDGKVFLVIGFNTTSTTEKTVYVYEYNNSTLNSVYSSNCVDYEIYDLDNDTKQDIVLIVNTVVTESQNETVAKMLKIQDSEVVEVSQTTMDDTNPRYVNVYTGKIEENINALYFDAQSGVETYTTEILTANNGQLYNLSLLNDNQTLVDSTRLAGLYCIDLNGDLIYEIPNNILVPGYEESSSLEKLYYTNWYNYSGGRLKIQSTTYTDYSLGYSFLLPDTWINENDVVGRVTATKNSANSEVLFSVYNEKTKSAFTDILSLRIFIRSTLVGDRLPYGYSEILSNGQLVYAYRIFDESGEYGITAENVITNFTVLN